MIFDKFQLLRNKEGLLHVSELTDDLVDKHPGGNLGLVSDHLRVGDKIEVLCTKIDPVQGSIRLSRKKLLRMRKNNVTSYSPTSMNQQPGTPPPPVNGLSKSLNPNRIQPTFDNEEDEEEDNHINVNNGLSDDQEEEAVIISIDGVDVTGDSESEDDESDFSDDDTDDVENDKYGDSDTDENAPSNQASSNEALWEQRLNQLIEYKGEKGNTNVPVRISPLGRWVKRQRELFKKGELSDDRINSLNEIGFEWQGVHKDLQWEKYFDELVAYKEEKGDTKVPRSLGKLGSWVWRQRQSFKEGAMTEERTNKLNELGFEWIINKKRKG